jgi:predicted nucleic-acid-binding Zn-ribbon protein
MKVMYRRRNNLNMRRVKKLKHASDVTVCPKCRSRELGKGSQRGYSAMQNVNQISLGSTIEYIICTECGYIIEGYVKKPEKFKGTLF